MEYLATLEAAGAVLRGKHIVYTSGLHGSEYVNKDALYVFPDKVSKFCEEIATRAKKLKPEVVLAPAIGAVILGQWVSYHLGEGVLSVYAEKSENGFVIKRGYDRLIQGRDVVIVEDILTTGGSVKKVIEVAKSLGANVVGVFAICNRGGIKKEDIGVDHLDSLVTMKLESWEAKDCPLCKRGVPITKGLGKG